MFIMNSYELSYYDTSDLTYGTFGATLKHKTDAWLSNK